MSTILVVDDSAVDRRLVGALLEKTVVCTVEYAANGIEALARMKDLVPDFVVTDLQMPVMDGLELVKDVRVHYPDVPVILMTAHGSETLAVEALECGAASYVPKSQLVQKLPRTVWEVSARADADRSSKHLLSCLARSEFCFLLENEARLIDPLVDLAQQMIDATGLCDFTGRLRIGIALREALLNALFHGNLEISAEQLEQVQDTLIQERDVSLVEERRSLPRYRDRRIFVEMEISPGGARFVVRDEGGGFDVTALPAPADPNALVSERGRGLVLMRTFMDEVVFNGTGNEVTMIKRRSGANGARPVSRTG
jgi:CheY-like chemotaxis protein